MLGYGGGREGPIIGPVPNVHASRTTADTKLQSGRDTKRVGYPITIRDAVSNFAWGGGDGRGAGFITLNLTPPFLPDKFIPFLIHYNFRNSFFLNSCI